MSNKMIKCKNCGNEINVKAAVCPNCGVANKKPFYKKGWFIAVVCIVIIIAITSMGGSDENTNTVQNTIDNSVSNEYTDFSVSQLVSDLENNALKAENTYKDKYVRLTGKLSNIDAGGKYISISPNDGSFTLYNIQCYLKTEEHKNTVMNMSIGDTIIVKGKITDIGEIFGYQMNVDSFE
ncbi:MAG: hypothetical protein J6L59_00645 [Clostridia bacterium]|nr:hypothetical protein [Clostridia bacterium]